MASHAVPERRVFWLAGLLLNVPVMLIFFLQFLPAGDTPSLQSRRPHHSDSDHFFVPIVFPPDPILSHGASMSAPGATSVMGHAPGQVANVQPVVVTGTRQPDSPASASVFERMRPAPATPELVAPMPLRPLAPTKEAALHVATRLGAYNDSLVTEHAAAKRAETWTKTDASGRRWGFTPGMVHLGSVSLKLAKTFGDSIDDVFQPPPGRRDEAKARMQLWNEIQLQARRAEANAVFHDRVKQIRERKQSVRKPGDPTQ